MNKLAALFADAVEALVIVYAHVRSIFWDAINLYEAGALQTFIQKRLGYLSWILIGFAMFLVSTIAHYIGFETLRTEIMILFVLIGVRFAARAGV